MNESSQAARWRHLRLRFQSLVLEREPFAMQMAREALNRSLHFLSTDAPSFAEEIDAIRPFFKLELEKEFAAFDVTSLPSAFPGTTPRSRLDAARGHLSVDCDGFLRREAIRAALSADERREVLGGMLITRAVDNRLKQLFMGSDVRFGDKAFQGKGFRSLGQEAIYAACLRLRRGPSFVDQESGRFHGDVIAPMIRDLGAVLAMAPDTEVIQHVLAAQMGKDGAPMAGRDLHVGVFGRGVLPPAAPLAISTANVTGMAFAMAREGQGRVALTFIGEGGTSLGEWHEAINVAAVHGLPVVFCVQNNQTALSTPVRQQSAVRVFADKGIGYGMPAVTVDGTDPDDIAAAFGWAVERARAGLGPTLIELVCLRMCGHAHHDDMLYLGKEPALGWDYPELHANGYADKEAWEYWSQREPIARYAERLEAEGIIGPSDFEVWKQEAEELVESATQAMIALPWPDPGTVGEQVFADGQKVERIEVLATRPGANLPPGLPPLEPCSFDARGRTFLDAIALGVRDALTADSRVFVYGEDVGGHYGNAFLMLRPLLADFPERILNSPLSEGGTIGLCVGAALEGLRPIGEMQFNDFVATGFNQLINNAAKIRYRWGHLADVSVPMVLRMPWGGLRSAGPYHSQDTSPWFYRTAGLKIVVPSTPEDARALLAAAVADSDPVLFYEHIGLYRDPKIKQLLDEAAPTPLPLGKAALRRAGNDLAIVAWGAYVHAALRCAEELGREGIESAVLDLRSLVPLDREALLRVAKHCGRVLIVQEDSRRGSVGESLAAIIQEEIFEYLDAPVRILGALDTPVPYSPPLEKAFLVGDDEILHAARLLLAY